MSGTRPHPPSPCLAVALLAGLVAAWSCERAVGPSTPGAPPSIAVTITPNQGDVPFGYAATIQVAGDSLKPALRLLVGGRQVSLPVSGPGTYAYRDTLRTPTRDTLRFRVESVNGRQDSASAIVSGTNLPPRITALTVSADSIAIGDSALIQVIVSDTRPGFTTVVTLGPTRASRYAAFPVDTTVLWAKPDLPGPQFASVTVTDPFGATARDSLPVRAFANPDALAITVAGIRDWIARLSDDSLRGRGTPGPEIETAALAIAARFRQLGLDGAFSGGYVQRFPCCTSPTSLTAPNVGAILRGSDPLLRDEFVVVVAHMDAVGATGPPYRCGAVGGDTICNGANDNASGTAAVLELAAAIAWRPTRPLRSVLFLAVSGEEEGLWGSTYFVSHPPIALANVVAALNVDMIGRNSPTSIYVAGLGRSTLGDRAAAIAQAHTELGLQLASIALSANSDHWPFAQDSVPALMFYNGSNADYHRPTDTVDRIDAELAARTTRLVYYTALDVLDGPARPQWHTAASGPPAGR